MVSDNKDLTVVYLTANKLSDHFAGNIREQLVKSIGDYPLISVSKKPIDFGENIVVDTPISHFNIYRDALTGIKAAKTKYIAIAEDDTLYVPQHFNNRSSPGVFAYNTVCWSLYTWSKTPIYSYSERVNHNVLICERDLYIEAIEERFNKWSDDSKINRANWAEPGKYEKHLGVTQRQTELFYTDPACIMFTHPEGLSHEGLGTRKRLAPIRALEIPYWGRAEEVIKLYK